VAAVAMFGEAAAATLHECLRPARQLSNWPGLGALPAHNRVCARNADQHGFDRRARRERGGRPRGMLGLRRFPVPLCLVVQFPICCFGYARLPAALSLPRSKQRLPYAICNRVFTWPRSNPDIMPPEPTVCFRETTKGPQWRTWAQSCHFRVPSFVLQWWKNGAPGEIRTHDLLPSEDEAH